MIPSRSSPSHSRIRLLIALAAIALGGCAKHNRAQVIRDCILNQDQRQTFKGHWRVTPVQVAFAPGFSGAEIRAAVAAFTSWNTFATLSRGYPFINYSDDGVNPRMRSAAPPADWQTACTATRLLSGSTWTGAVMLYRQSNWRYSANAMAISSECHDVVNGSINSFYNAQIEFNTQYYFAGGSTGRYPDLETITLHEIGHIMGLDHSCGNSPLPSCSTAPPSYIEAVMYPAFGFDAGGAGEQKRSLRDNDEGRANCLYDAAS